MTWSDGTKTHSEANEITVVGYDPNKRGSQMLPLKYGVVETTITVELSDIAKKLTLDKGKSCSLKPVLAPFTSQEKITYSFSKSKQRRPEPRRLP